jgi:hypothetical protein
VVEVTVVPDPGFRTGGLEWFQSVQGHDPGQDGGSEGFAIEWGERDNSKTLDVAAVQFEANDWLSLCLDIL